MYTNYTIKQLQKRSNKLCTIEHFAYLTSLKMYAKILYRVKEFLAFIQIRLNKDKNQQFSIHGAKQK